MSAARAAFWDQRWSRRELLRSLLGAGVLALAGVRSLPAARAAATREGFQVGFLGPGGAAASGPAGSVARGVELGAEEAAHTAALLGRRFEVVRGSAGAGGAAALPAGAFAVVAPLGLLGSKARASLAKLAGERRVLLLDPLPPDGEREEPAGQFLFRTGASAAERQAVLASYRAKGKPAGEGLRAVEWHPALVASGAAQLNERFAARFGRPMDGPAWAGWAAVKALSELALRGGTGGDLPARLLALRFDGHKGVPLAFDPAAHGLRQPLYVVAAAGRLVGDAARGA